MVYMAFSRNVDHSVCSDDVAEEGDNETNEILIVCLPKQSEYCTASIYILHQNARRMPFSNINIAL